MCVCMLQNMCDSITVCVCGDVGMCFCCGCMAGVERGFALSHVMLYYEHVSIAIALGFSQSGAVAEFPAKSYTHTHKPMCI